MDEERIISKRIKASIEQQQDDIPAKDYRFYQVDQLMKLVGILESEKECTHCKSNLSELDPLLMDIKSIMNDREKRVRLEKLTDNSVKHLRKVHKYYLPRYFNYTFSFIGMLIGLTTGSALAYIRDYPSKLIIILSGWFLGLVVGRILGSIKDKNNKRIGKQI